jgi:hypothetical protein
MTREDLGATLSESLDDGARRRQSARKAGELLGPLGVHVVFLIVYTLIWFGLGYLWQRSLLPGTLDSKNETSAVAELVAAGWLELVVLPIWFIVAALLVWWWRQKRQRLVRRTLAWDSLLWLGFALAFLVTWKRTRPFLVPPKPNMIGAPGSDLLTT